MRLIKENYLHWLCLGTVTEEKYRKAPTFEEFIRFLVDLPVRQYWDEEWGEWSECLLFTWQLSEYDPHWRPMFIQCLPCHIAYRVVARVESLATDSQYILQTIGLNTRLPVSHQTGASHTSSLTAQYFSQIGNFIYFIKIFIITSSSLQRTRCERSCTIFISLILYCLILILKNCKNSTKKLLLNTLQIKW